MTHLSFPNLSGKLVDLRELSIEDAIIIVSLMSHDISEYLYEVSPPYKIGDVLKFIKFSCDGFRLHKSIIFAIDYKKKSEPIQLLVETIGIKDIDYVNKKANIGYWIGKQYQGKGLATECVKLVITYGFDILKLIAISAYVFPENKPSIRVLEKNKFVKTEVIKEYHPLSNSYRNSLVYTIKNKK